MKRDDYFDPRKDFNDDVLGKAAKKKNKPKKKIKKTWKGSAPYYLINGVSSANNRNPTN